MAKYTARGTLTTGSGTYQVEVGTTHGGSLTFTVVSAALHRTPGVVDSALLSSKRQGMETEDEDKS